MCEVMNSLRVILYEPRTLYRFTAQHALQGAGYNVKEVASNQLTEEMCYAVGSDIVIAIGIAGAGAEISTILHSIRELTLRKRQVVVWLPEENNSLFKLMQGLGVSHIFSEMGLYNELMGLPGTPMFISPLLTPPPMPAIPNSIGKISRTELKHLLDFSRGMTAKEIANFRHVSYKTVFTHKKNITYHLNLNTSAEWLELLSRIELIRSLWS